MSLLVTDEELDNLPSDHYLAFIAFEKIARERTYDAIVESDYSAEARYISNVVMMADALDIKEVSNIEGRYGEVKNYGEFFSFVLDTVDRLSIKYRLSLFKERRAGKGVDLRITPDVAEALRFHLTQLRSAIDRIDDLPTRKREVIVKKLSELDYEISTSRTKWESWMDLAIELADTTSEVADKLVPAKKLLDAIFKRLGKAKADSQGLPPPEKQRQIEHQQETSDEDIPF